MSRVVIVGGGHAAAQLCASLAELAPDAQVTLVSAEPELPYHRPPLSKTFLKESVTQAPHIRGETAYQEHRVATHLSARAGAIDREARELVLDDGRRLPYDALVLATGARARALPGLPEGATGIAVLRTLADALALREQLAAVDELTVLGGGFIGLEVAASARVLGKRVRLLEAGARLQARTSSPEISEFLLREQLAAGVEVELDARTERLLFDDARRLRAIVVNGEERLVSLLLAAIGAVPEIELAQQAGLACDVTGAGGITVDAQLRTSDPAIYAIGDCADFPAESCGGAPGTRLRLESVQNANDQARTVAAVLAGQDKRYKAVPWFWSEQGAVRLQIAGLVPAQAERLRRPGKGERDFSILHFVGDRLVAVESVNAPVDHMAARKLVDQERVSRAQAVDPAVPLKSLIAPAA